MNPSDVQVTAGLGGFVVLFGLAMVLWFLGRDLSRRLRRMRQSEAEHAQTEATETEATTAEATTAEQDPSATDPPVSPPRP